jgi:hypothetical protein|tara:strand:- start:161397 stop:162368 length:972 start_codon:yes stop_codon:yes gene_type:complete
MFRSLLVTAILALFATTATAHHNWSAIYDVNSDIEIEGVISAIEWRNPHIRVSFTVDGGAANEKIYTTESNSVSSLTRMDVTSDLLAVGTQVRVAGYRSRTSDTDIFMNHLLLPSNREVIFLRTAESRWPDANRIGSSAALHGGVVEDDVSKRPTSIFAVWNTIYGAQGSHQSLKFDGVNTGLEYLSEQISNNCAVKDLWVAMGTPYPIQLIDNGATVIIHAEEFDTIRTVYMNVDHNDPGTNRTNLGYSTGRIIAGTLAVTTTFEGNGSSLQMHETFHLSADHNRLEYTQNLIDPDSSELPIVNRKWWQYLPGGFVQPYDCV